MARVIPPHESYLYLPARAGRAALEEFERRNTASIRLGWGVPSVDDYVVPMMPGELVVLVGRPGMLKTTALIHLARNANAALQAEELHGTRYPSYVVYATWETLVEEFVAVKNAFLSGVAIEDIGRGRADLKPLTDSIMASLREKIAIVGMSVSRRHVLGSSTPTLADVDTAIGELILSGNQPSLLLFDYLQRIPGQPGRDRNLAVSENLELIKDMALRFHCPAVVAVQAKREVDAYTGLRLPGLNDGQWTSTIEQTADKIFSLTRPFLYWDKDDLTIGGRSYAVTPRTVCIKVVKQRWSDAGRIFVLDFDPRTGVLGEAPIEDTIEESASVM